MTHGCSSRVDGFGLDRSVVAAVLLYRTKSLTNLCDGPKCQLGKDYHMCTATILWKTIRTCGCQPRIQTRDLKLSGPVLYHWTILAFLKYIAKAYLI